ncbi:MAG: hypothetical protein QG588_2056, partial [Candidatus Poribacteria bacterium]|nr:hypothetical protein [Candidatus Poribacteria bacterium]
YIMFKCAFLGCEGRARGHAHAYKFIKRGKIVAICDFKDELRNKFGDDFGIEKRYKDIHEMLDKEKPNLLHIVTAPFLRGTTTPIRYSLNIASEHGVPSAIVEKPIAVMSEDWRDLKELSKRTKTKFVVNTQLNFHPKNLELKQDVAEGKIGEIKFIDASARLTPVDLGNLMSPRVLEDTGDHAHKRVMVVGTRGFVHWLEDDLKVHPTHLDQSLAEFNILLGIYQSALTHAPVDLPFDPPFQMPIQ